MDKIFVIVSGLELLLEIIHLLCNKLDLFCASISFDPLDIELLFDLRVFGLHVSQILSQLRNLILITNGLLNLCLLLGRVHIHLLVQTLQSLLLVLAQRKFVAEFDDFFDLFLDFLRMIPLNFLHPISDVLVIRKQWSRILNLNLLNCSKIEDVLLLLRFSESHQMLILFGEVLLDFVVFPG